MSAVEICCSSCRQSKSSSDYSKSQLKKLTKNPATSVICELCNANGGQSHIVAAPVSVLAQAAKTLAQETSKRAAAEDVVFSNDPSLQYYKHPLRAPIVKTFQDYFKTQFSTTFPPDSHTPEVFYNRRKEGWRTASKLPVRSEISIENDKVIYNTKIGLFTPGSHAVVECLSSPIHHPAINHALVVIKASMERVGLYGYHDSIGDDLHALEKSKACIKYLMIAVQRHTHAVQVTFVTQSPRTSRVLNPLIHSLVDDLVAASSSSNSHVKFHSIWINHHYASKHCNTVTGRDAEDWRVLFSATDPEAPTAMGKGSILEYLDDYDAIGKLIPESGQIKDKKHQHSSHSTAANPSVPISPVAKIPLFFPPNVFRQANLGVFRTIVYDIRHWLTQTQQQYSLVDLDCLELYGGVGTIGLHCLDLVRRLVCSDENPNNEACFYRSVHAMLQDPQLAGMGRKISYLTGKSADLAQRGLIHQNFDVLIVDPPRKGLEPEVMEQLLLDTTSSTLEKLDSNSDNNRKRKIPSQPINKKKIFVDTDENLDASISDVNAMDVVASGTGLSAERTLKRLIYVSCGFEAFQRDCAMLTGDESVRQSYSVSQTTSYPTMISSAYVPGMLGTVHTHYHHNDHSHKHKKRKLSASTSISKEDPLEGKTGESSSSADPHLTNRSKLDREKAIVGAISSDDRQEAKTNPSTDATSVHQKGKWKLVFAKGYLMFPGANHIETLAIFDQIK